MIKMSTQAKFGVALLVLLVATVGCVSVPPEVARTHQKQAEIIKSLENSHLAMVNSFIDQKLQNFEHFFFHEYGPVFLSNWINAFEELNGRPYDKDKDFPTLYNDLVAEYQAESAPIEAIRVQLRGAIEAEYRNALSAHRAIGGWLDSLEKLNVAQRQAINDLLSAIKPGLSLEAVDGAVKTAKENIKERIEKLTNQ
ncbi:MAG: hypothetical protein M5R41_07115 [Bacteroidia bacterium]|nr:hypothetical protein [Bacteroidia bacterium]